MRRRIYWLITVAFFLAAVYEYVQYRREQAWLGERAREIVGAASATTTQDKVLALRGYVRQHVHYEALSKEDRPYLRDTAKATLETGQGYCGEAVRAYINLAAQVGVNAQRVNLHGRLQHVVAETEVSPGKWVLVDVQDNLDANKFLDAKSMTVDQLINDPDSPFYDYSNLNLRRVPLVSSVVQRVKLHNGPLTWLVENPTLLKAVLLALADTSLIGFWGFDRLLLRFYAYRLGVRIRRTPSPGTKTRDGSPPCVTVGSAASRDRPTRTA